MRDYTLDVRFRDGSRGTVDLTDEVENYEPFKPLRDKRRFAEVYTDGVTICWPNELDLAPNYLYARVHGLPIPDSMEASRRNEQEMSLRMLREFAGMTQEEVATELELPQSAISRFESRTDPKISTLQRYVSALGGHLEIAAVVGDRRIVLHGFDIETKNS